MNAYTHIGTKAVAIARPLPAEAYEEHHEKIHEEARELVPVENLGDVAVVIFILALISMLAFI